MAFFSSEVSNPGVLERLCPLHRWPPFLPPGQLAQDSSTPDRGYEDWREGNPFYGMIQKLNTSIPLTFHWPELAM